MASAIDASLLRRLQVKGDRRLCVIGLPAGIGRAIDAQAHRADCGDADVVLLFVDDRAMFEDRLPPVLARIRADAILWLAYVKRSSAKARDLDRDLLHGAVKAYGLTTVGQIAIDADWSALRLKRIA